jgi:hypothetical protein
MWYHKIFGEPEDPKKVAEDLNSEYSEYLGKLCFTGSEYAVYKYFGVEKGKVHLYYKNSQTPRGLINLMEFEWMKVKYDDKNFIINQRNRFIRLHHDLKLMGFKISKIINEG